MPFVEINMLEGRTPEQKEAVMRAVTEAVHTTLDAPLRSIRVWIREFKQDEYLAGGEFVDPAVALAPRP